MSIPDEYTDVFLSVGIYDVIGLFLLVVWWFFVIPRMFSFLRRELTQQAKRADHATRDD